MPLDRPRFQIGLPTVVTLVVLRLVVGWHFYSEGVKHLTEPGWTSEGFLRQAKGPLAPNYQAVIPGYDRWETLLSKTLHGKPGEISPDDIKPEDGKPKVDMTAGQDAVHAWTKQIKSQWDKYIRLGVPVSATAEFIPAEGDKKAQVSVTAKIDPGLHIYSLTENPDNGPVATAIHVRTSPDFRVTGEFTPVKPPADYVDPLFENRKMQIHQKEVTWQAPVEFTAGAAKDLKPQGDLLVQVCSDVNGSPPQTISFGGSSEAAAKNALSDEQKTLLEQLYEEREAQLDDWVNEHLDTLLVHIHEWRRMEAERAKPYSAGAPFQNGRVAGKRATLSAESAGFVKQIKALDDAFQRDLATVLRPEQAGAPYDTSPLHTIDTVLAYGIWIVGICLILGLFTRLAAVLGALFLLSVIASQPFWLADSIPTYSQALEMFVLVALSTTAVGRWGGLDFFIHNYRRLLQVCCGTKGEAHE